MSVRTKGLPAQPVRRVRDDARERLAVMGFSLATSAGLALVLRLLTELGK